ncbi:choline/carnitine O-acyltransferase [Corynebacterium frankenforstense]|uniref:choline/carnitine O-acyltransferase n=1 Tax=Corynebacterium frankenforstense TaxID=1230998 RepID=UPI003C6C3859
MAGGTRSPEPLTGRTARVRTGSLARVKPLPVPPLNDTLESTLSCVDAVIDDAAPTHRLAHDFAVGAGPRIQEALENYAAERAAAGSSWARRALAGRLPGHPGAAAAELERLVPDQPGDLLPRGGASRRGGARRGPRPPRRGRR